MEHRAFTSRADGKIREIRTPAGIFSVATANEQVPNKIIKFDAIWDTGATNTAISSRVVELLNLQPISFRQVGTGGGVVDAPVHLVNIALPNNVIIPQIEVTELSQLNNCDVLIGMDVISIGDFALTHLNNRACFSFRIPSNKEIDFVPESNSFNIKLQSKVGKSIKSIKRPKRKKKK